MKIDNRFSSYNKSDLLQSNGRYGYQYDKWNAGKEVKYFYQQGGLQNNIEDKVKRDEELVFVINKGNIVINSGVDYSILGWF